MTDEELPAHALQDDGEQNPGEPLAVGEAEIRPAAVGLTLDDVRALLQEEVPRLVRAELRATAGQGFTRRRDWGLAPTLLWLLLVASVGVAGVLSPRWDAAGLWEALVGDNLLADGSFELGTWQPEPGDCCVGNPGAARLFLGRVADATDGRYALQLSSENHCACVANAAHDFRPGLLYLLSFDYRAVEGAAPPRYVVVQQAAGGQVFAPQASLKGGEGWQHHQVVFAAEPGATGAQVFLYADSDGNGRTANRYDNVRLAPLGAE